MNCCRGHGDQRRSISYINAFSNSSLAAQLIKWIRKQIHVEESDSKSYGSSPKSLISKYLTLVPSVDLEFPITNCSSILFFSPEWLLNLEDQGLRVFDDSVLKSHAKLVRDTPKSDFEQPASKLQSMKVDDDLLFYIDNKGEELDRDEENEKMNEAMTAAFVAAAHSMKSADNGGKKRKEGRSTGKKRKGKFLKYEPLQNSESASGRTPVVSYENESSGSEVDNPPSDEDSEQDEQ